MAQERGQKTMSVDGNLFFREATLRLCSSLHTEAALQRCYEYIRHFMPVAQMTLHILDFEQNVLRVVAMVGAILLAKKEKQ